METISGHVERITYFNAENSFTVAKLKCTNISEPVPIVGKMPGIAPGESLTCMGQWKMEAKHGRQFQVSSFEKTAPATLIGIEKYLASGLIVGIGPKFAKKIVQTFGLQTLHILEEQPEKLLAIEGLGKKKLDRVVHCFQQHKCIQDVMVFLQSYQVSPAYAQKIFKFYGTQSVEVVRENPYKLARDIKGIGFKIADQIASSLSITKQSPARIAAGIEFLLEDLSSKGHVCFPKGEFLPHAAELLDVEMSLIEPVLFQLHAEKRIAIEKLQKEDFVWLKPLHISEYGIVREIYRLQDHACALRPIDSSKALDWIQEKLKLKFAPAQREAIKYAVSDKIHIITGGPGTGKSTITKAIIQITEKLSKRVVLAAPTGRAAKRMSEITYRSASTIHSLLKYNFAKGGFQFNSENPISADLVIVDEASMIDTKLFYHLLKAIPSSCRVLLIGDIDQLPSVGPGNILRDIIDSKAVPTSTLTYIFRQGRGSKIAYSAHLINEGMFPKLKAEKTDDFFFIEAKEPEGVLETIAQLVSKRIPEKYNFNPIEDIQALSPMKKGLIGTENLNLKLQSMLNKSQNFIVWYGKRFALGDKVMQLKNNYQKEVYNGDIGSIQSLDQNEQFLEIKFDSRLVNYQFSELDEVSLAYCVSIHKYQGSEAPCIVMPIHTHHFKLLCRNLLYTGITRGKKLVILVGTKKALAIAIKNNEIKNRFSALKELLQTRLPIQ
ncbi:MAG: ATP-dependent RecD-like DNA helicase [Chlamydiae bacterium]|nr:ATP-dependent RecD-like DNA helicase [Chlamydiota bacterium]